MLPDLTQYLWIVWLVLALLFITIEMFTLEFTFLMLGAGTLLGGLGLNLLGAPWWGQVLGAAAVSSLLLFLIRPLLLRVLRKSNVSIPMNVDALAGMGGRVMAPFVEAAGSVRLDNGELWTARLAGTDPGLDAGSRVVVRSVQGATVEVVAAPAEDPSPEAPSTPSPQERNADNA